MDLNFEKYPVITMLVTPELAEEAVDAGDLKYGPNWKIGPTLKIELYELLADTCEPAKAEIFREKAEELRKVVMGNPLKGLPIVSLD